MSVDDDFLVEAPQSKFIIIQAQLPWQLMLWNQPGPEQANYLAKLQVMLKQSFCNSDLSLVLFIAAVVILCFKSSRFSALTLWQIASTRSYADQF